MLVSYLAEAAENLDLMDSEGGPASDEVDLSKSGGDWLYRNLDDETSKEKKNRKRQSLPSIRCG